MRWTVCIFNKVEHRINFLSYGERVDPNDVRYMGEDYHAIPVKGDGPLLDTETFSLGVHELKRGCACKTKVRTDFIRALVIHNPKVN